LELYENQDPKKPHQDCLDAAICAIVGLIWRACDGNDSAIIGDTNAGYMVTPVSQATQLKLKDAAASKKVRFDQACS
jgi:predicted RNase H-like nuclease